MIDAAVRRYFTARYPRRDAPLARWFRAGEAERRHAIAPWLAGARSVLDAGCGDGELLAAMLPADLDDLWLLDIAGAALARARDTLASRARSIHTLHGDVDVLALPTVDVAMALGVSDYHRDWPGLVATLRRAASQHAIVDFPRAGTPRGVARRGWLAAHGVALHTATEAEVRALIPDAELVATELHWIVRIPARRIHHVMTVDLEDWFHCLEPEPARWSALARRAEAPTRRLLDLFDEHGATATFFVLGDVARHAPWLVAEIVDRGHEIGSHGTSHRMITAQTPAAFRADLAASLARLSDLANRPILSYRAPFFSITRRSLWALDILREHGIVRDSSIFPVRNPRYGIPDAEPTPHEIRPGLVEWPISVLATRAGNVPFAGGVYFRWLPFRLIRHAFRTFEARGQRVVFYVHPWELDREQPYRALSPFLFARHHGRRAVTEPRMRALLAAHRFESLAGASA